MFILYREDRTVTNPSGEWAVVGKFKTLVQAQAKERLRVSMMPRQYSDKNPDRQYHCIEEIVE